MTDHLLQREEDGVAVLTMNRPDSLNAMSDEMMSAMLDSLTRLAEDDSIGCVVLTGAGRGFCAGGDVKSMAVVYIWSNPRKEEILGSLSVLKSTNPS